MSDSISEINKLYLPDYNGALQSFTASQYFLSDLNTAPSSATDIGTKGELRFTSGYIYVCINTNSWVRAALSAW